MIFPRLVATSGRRRTVLGHLAHRLNNGHLTVSPMVNGSTVLGGVDPIRAVYR
jgi:hypothetical protein